MRATAVRSDRVLERTMKAVILYDEVDFARKAQAMLARAGHRTDDTTQWNVKPWRVHLLALTGIADAALTDAADAHLMVLEVRHQAELSRWLSDWLEQWATRRQIQGAALAVFDGGNHGTCSASAAVELSQLAERHGLSFILGDMGPAEDESASLGRSLQGRERVLTPTLPQRMAVPVLDYSRGWGINESVARSQIAEARTRHGSNNK
jgi:hypothetical protein